MNIEQLGPAFFELLMGNEDLRGIKGGTGVWLEPLGGSAIFNEMGKTHLS